MGAHKHARSSGTAIHSDQKVSWELIGIPGVSRAGPHSSAMQLLVTGPWQQAACSTRRSGKFHWHAASAAPKPGQAAEPAPPTCRHRTAAARAGVQGL